MNHQAADLAEFLDFYARPGGLNVTPIRARYVLGRVTLAPVQEMDDTLPAGFTPRRECTRPGDQWVWASDQDLAVVVHQSARTTHYYTQPQVIELWRTSVEVLGDHDRYQDRLDELAGVARQPVAA